MQVSDGNIGETTKPVAFMAAKVSGWPGAAIELPRSRGPGRPRKAAAEQTILVTIVLSTDAYAKILARASAAGQLLNEWISNVLRADGPSVPAPLDFLPGVNDPIMMLRARVPKMAVVRQQAGAAGSRLMLTQWLAVVVTHAAQDTPA